MLDSYLWVRDYSGVMRQITLSESVIEASPVRNRSDIRKTAGVCLMSSCASSTPSSSGLGTGWNTAESSGSQLHFLFLWSAEQNVLNVPNPTGPEEDLTWTQDITIAVFKAELLLQETECFLPEIEHPKCLGGDTPPEVTWPITTPGPHAPPTPNSDIPWLTFCDHCLALLRYFSSYNFQFIRAPDTVIASSQLLLIPFQHLVHTGLEPLSSQIKCPFMG